FQQRAAFVQPRLTQAEGGIHVEMGVHEGRGDQPPAGVDLAGRRGLDRRADLGDAPIFDGDVLRHPPVGQIGAADQKIQHQFSSLFIVEPAGKNGRPCGPICRFPAAVARSLAGCGIAAMERGANGRSAAGWPSAGSSWAMRGCGGSLPERRSASKKRRTPPSRTMRRWITWSNPPSNSPASQRRTLTRDLHFPALPLYVVPVLFFLMVKTL